MSQRCLGYDNDTIFIYGNGSVTSHHLATNATGHAESPSPAITQLCGSFGSIITMSNATYQSNVTVFNTTASTETPWFSLNFTPTSANDQIVSVVASESAGVTASVRSADSGQAYLQSIFSNNATLQKTVLTNNPHNTPPLLATDPSLTSLFLLGYPSNSSISYFETSASALANPDKPTLTFACNDTLPASGFVQSINQYGNHLVIYDNNHNLYAIKMDPSSSTASVVSRSYPGMDNVLAVSDFGNESDFPTLYSVKTAPNGYSFLDLPTPSNTSITPRDPGTVLGQTGNNINLPVVIGAAVGGGVVVGLLLACLYVCYRRRNTKYRGSNKGHRLPSHDDLNGLYRDDGQDQLESGMQKQPMIDDVGDEDFGVEDDEAFPPPIDTSIDRLGPLPSSNSSSILPSRGNSFRQRIDNFLDRMSSLRSTIIPLSPNSFSFSPVPVEDQFQKVRTLQMNQTNMTFLDPMVVDKNDTLIFSGKFQLVDEAIQNDEDPHLPGYTTRTIMQVSSGTLRTLHYFPSHSRDAFIRNVNTSMVMRRTRWIVRHHRAAALPSPLPSGHQYYWISSLASSRNSLYYLLHHDNVVVDIREHTFLVLSIQSILRAVTKIHTADYCHLSLSPRYFFYEQASTITDWLLTGFYQSYVVGQNDGHPLKLDIYSAPELIVAAVAADDGLFQCYRFRAQFEMDAWSTGCLLYEILTGKPLFKDVMQLRVLCGSDPETSPGLQQHLAEALTHPLLADFPPILQQLLQPVPEERAAVSSVYKRWIRVNELDQLQ
ncbi:hypothetical protein DM01DRAFT_1384391 [Hesseltinella vesiculosa]|uniref:Protein kinase domain-containing protein n=1 Tax=Hesseltinella vesiculosa TaxID=101127 RepID=A0A1X2GE21_9FUNG|nr:hypothetical protein DM01DRAFT_1384391 [Hesseltinella vesiculosa]